MRERKAMRAVSAATLTILASAALLLAGARAQVVIQKPAPPRTGQPPQERMEPLARKLNLGARRADSASPQPTQSGHGEKAAGYYQCFERGCVYYGAGAGVHAVTGAIFEKFVAEGYERGPLGFPVSDERQCVPPPPSRNWGTPRAYVPSASYQDFEGGSIVVAGAEAGGFATRLPTRVGDAGVCDAPPPPREPASSGRFRITINGFACRRPTYDDATQRDGADDEVYLTAFVKLYDRETSRNQPGARSLVLGDANGFPDRVRAGSGSSIFGGNGGFREGDTFPAGGRPWERSATPGGDRPPLLVWEGELVRGEHALLILPTLWEWDTPYSLETPYVAAVAAAWGDDQIEAAARRMSQFDAGPRVTFGDRLADLFGGVRISKDSLGDPKSRPVGMIDRGDHYAFAPRALVFTYQSAARVASLSLNGAPGVYRLDFDDDERLRGAYTLYIQVEQLR
jgi:hypothetical protein